jgi:hypothetical protein
MSKQLFEAVANTLAAIDNPEKRILQVSWWIKYFTNKYPRFNPDMFIDYYMKARMWYVDNAAQFVPRIGMFVAR